MSNNLMVSASFTPETIQEICSVLGDVQYTDNFHPDVEESALDAERTLRGLSESGPVVFCKASDYFQMVKDQAKLEALIEAGVDNWVGYDDAMDSYFEWGE